MEERKAVRYLTMLAVAGFVMQVVIGLEHEWRIRVSNDFNARARESGNAAGELNYPALAEKPVLAGILVALIVFSIGALLISGYEEPTEKA